MNPGSSRFLSAGEFKKTSSPASWNPRSKIGALRQAQGGLWGTRYFPLARRLVWDDNRCMMNGLRTSVTPRTILICRILGLVIFAAAFLLPACREAGPVNAFTNTFKGWECAKITFTATFEKDSYESWDFLAVMSGWINPLILIYMPFSFFPRFKKVRRSLTVGVLVCMAATWTFFIVAHLVPLIGHFMWIAGALMILAAEVAGRPRRA